MRRWHAERNLMLRRWREEIATHTYGDEGCWWSYYGQAPLPPDYVQPDSRGEVCHCVRGPGFMRKRTVHGCSNPHCLICHWEKFCDLGRRTREKREAFAYEWEATGGW